MGNKTADSIFPYTYNHRDMVLLGIHARTYEFYAI